MSFFANFKKTAKSLPLPIWIAAIIIPGGMTVIGVYMAYKSAKKPVKEQNLREFMDQVIKEDSERPS